MKYSRVICKTDRNLQDKTGKRGDLIREIQDI